MKTKRLLAFLISGVLVFNTLLTDAYAAEVQPHIIVEEKTEETQTETKEETEQSDEVDLSGETEESAQYDDPVEILTEDSTKREENVKVFLNEDYSYTAAVYP